MKVLKAEKSHLGELVQLFDAYRVWYRKDSDVDTALNFLSERIKKNESTIFVTQKEDGELTGFTQLYPIFSSTRMKRMWLLNDLYVKPEYRGQGHSKMLIEKSKELSRQTNACGILLETEKSNDVGNQLYPRTGFELEGNNFYFWTNE